MDKRGKDAVEAQKQLIVELCKERYPDSLDVSEILLSDFLRSLCQS